MAVVEVIQLGGARMQSNKPIQVDLELLAPEEVAVSWELNFL